MALSEFHKMLERGDYRVYWQFVMKMLLIMDRCLEQRVMIDEITSYQNRSLEEFQNSGQGHSSSLINGFVSRYYAYIKDKAKVLSQPKSIFLLKPRDRLVVISKMGIETVEEALNTAHSMQKEVLDISNGYRNGNKKIKLMEYVFCNLLNTALSAYTIQSICTSVLISTHGLTQPRSRSWTSGS